MISVVIPIFNESENIEELYSKLKDVLPATKENYEIIFIDDGSEDNSFKILYNIKKMDDTLKVIKFRRNFGQTAALFAGIRHAKGDLIFTMDGDLQNDPEDIPTFLENLDEYDVLSGWRAERRDSLSKKITSRFSNWLHRKLTGLDIHDSGCTFKLYRREALRGIELYGEIHRFIPALLHWKGFKVGEIKVNHHERKNGMSKYGIWRLVKGFLDLINIKFWTQYSARPLHFFGPIGLLLQGTGGLIGLYLVALKYLKGASLSDRPLLLLSVLMVIIGMQVLVFGFLAEVLIKIYYNGERKNYEIEKIYEYP